MEVETRTGWTAQDKPEMVRLYLEEKIGLKTIAKQFGCHTGVIRRAITKAGHSMRSCEEGKAVSRAYAARNDKRYLSPEWVARRKEKADSAWLRASLRQCRKRWGNRRLTEEERLAFNAKVKERYHSDPQARQREIWRSRLQKALKRYQHGPARRMGCKSAYQLVDHIEAQWEPGMTWENYGRASRRERRWQIDHIIPVTSFDLTNDKRAAECWHYTNLQPMWFDDNLRKGNKIMLGFVDAE